MCNAELDELQVVIKNAWRNINTLRYADDTILMAESEEESKNLLMKLKEESEKVILKFNNNNKSKIMVFYPITSQQIEGGKVEALTDFLFSGSKITGDMVTEAMKLQDTCFLAGKL